MSMLLELKLLLLEVVMNTSEYLCTAFPLLDDNVTGSSPLLTFCFLSVPCSHQCLTVLSLLQPWLTVLPDLITSTTYLFLSCSKSSLFFFSFLFQDPFNQIKSDSECKIIPGHVQLLTTAGKEHKCPGFKIHIHCQPNKEPSVALCEFFHKQLKP